MLVGVQCLPVMSEEPDARNEKQLVALACHIHDRQRDGRIDAFRDHIDIFVIDPFAHDTAGDVGLILVIGGNDLDLAAGQNAADIIGGQQRSFRGASPVSV